MRKKIMVVFFGWFLLSTSGSSSIAIAKEAAHNSVKGTITLSNVSEAEYPALALITMENAVKTALARVPGELLKVEMEDEDGFLVYGVELVTAEHTVFEVKVDAGSGHILLVEKDDIDTDQEDHSDLIQ